MGGKGIVVAVPTLVIVVLCTLCAQDFRDDIPRDAPPRGIESKGTAAKKPVAAPATHARAIAQDGDTLREVALREVGDARAAHVVWKLNPGLGASREIPAGRVLTLPPRDGWASAEKAQLSLRLFDFLDFAHQSRLGLRRSLPEVAGLYLAAQTLLLIVLGPLALFMGGRAVGSFEANFTACALVNFKGAMVGLVAGLVGWAIAGAAVATMAELPFAALPLESLMGRLFALLAAISAAELATYVFVVRSRLKVGVVRAAGACFFAFLLHGAILLAGMPPLIVAALDA